MIKPSILPGFIELLPEDQLIFEKLKEIIEENYKKAGFTPIDTPVLEKKEVLLAKGGGETEKQVYELNKGKTDMAMRFDLTVPLARYVAQHYSELSFPFRRYHIAKVYRGERNQKGRYREFYQCDIDIVGDEDLHYSNDAEIVSIIYRVFQDLGLKDITIHLNHRKILSGFFDFLGIQKHTDVLRSLDKMDKIGWEEVEKLLEDLDLDQEQITELKKFVSIQGSNHEILDYLSSLAQESPAYQEAVEEFKEIVDLLRSYGVDEKSIQIDTKISRGLDYYTGLVFETTLNGHEQIGSVCSGGRYDHLAQHYSNKNLPGVGMSIGLSRLFYQLKAENLLKIESASAAKVLVLPMEGYLQDGIELVEVLRKGGISSFVYSEKPKMKKMFKYADSIKVPYVVILGEEEAKKKEYALRNMESGKQELLSRDGLIEFLK